MFVAGSRRIDRTETMRSHHRAQHSRRIEAQSAGIGAGSGKVSHEFRLVTAEYVHQSVISIWNK